jgi:hypothetical protein
MSEPTPARVTGSAVGDRSESGPGPDLAAGAATDDAATDRAATGRESVDGAAAGQASTDDAAESITEPAAGLVRVRPQSVDVDPEDWTASPGSTDDRILRERPPHW